MNAGGDMRTTVKRFVAAVCGVVTTAAPGMAWAEKPCPTYFQVQSTATGGEFVGGLLFSESSRTLTDEKSKTTTTSLTANTETEIKLPVGSVSGGGTVTTTVVEEEKSTLTGTFNVGVYKMNDGSTWLVNCDQNTQMYSVG
jgi:hypothetical protein